MIRTSAAVCVPSSVDRLDPEVDPHVVAVEVDRRDLADLDPGDPHLVAGLEAAGLGERGRVDCAAPSSGSLSMLNASSSRRDHGRPTAPIDDRVALAERDRPPRRWHLAQHQLHLAADEW